MDAKKFFCFLFSSAGMLALILDGETALQAASEAVSLCVKALIPSLFPFLFHSSVLTTALWGTEGKLLRCIGVLTGIPSGAESILISGFLGGYPSGAQCIGQAYRQGSLDVRSAGHLLSFCSNAGPAFLFGVVGPQFSDQKTVWVLWSIHILSAFSVSLFRRENTACTGVLTEMKISFSKALSGAVHAMGLLCGWVIVFRILLTFLDRWFLWVLPKQYRILLWGFVELSNGCYGLATIPSEDLRFLLCSVFLAFGGVCVIMQTASVTDGLPLKYYIRGKILHAAFALLMSVLYLRSSSMFLPVLIFLLVYILKKTVAISGIPMYNAGIIIRRSSSCCFGKRSPTAAPIASTAQDWRMDRSSAQKRVCAAKTANASASATIPASGSP